MIRPLFSIILAASIPFLSSPVLAAGLSEECRAALESQVTRTLVERLEGHGARQVQAVLMVKERGTYSDLRDYATHEAFIGRGLTTTDGRIYDGLVVRYVTARISDLREYLESDLAKEQLYWAGVQFSQAAIDRWLAAQASEVTPPRPPIRVPGINLPAVHRLVRHALKTRPGDTFSISVQLKNPLTLDEQVELEYLGSGPARAQYYRERVAAHHAEVRHLIEELARQPGVATTVNFERNPIGVTLRGPIGLFEPLFTHRDVASINFMMPMPTPPLPRP